MYDFQLEILFDGDECSSLRAELGQGGVPFPQRLHRQQKLRGELSMFSNGYFDDSISMNLFFRQV